MRQVVILLCLLLAITALCRAQDVEPPEWLFDDNRESEEELQDWVAVNQMSPLELDVVKDGAGQDRGVLLTESLGADPYFFPGGGWDNVNYEPFSGADFHILYMGVRVNAPNTWQLYYITEEDTTWGEVQRQNFEVAATDDFGAIEVDIERGGWQDHTVLRFRIDPGTQAGIEAEIDYISLRGVPGGVQPVQPQDKLAATWATLKVRR